MANKKSKRGSGRSVSVTKLRNQRRNKLVKKGKLKPRNSNDPFIKAKNLAAKQNKTKTKHSNNKDENHGKHEEQEETESNFDVDDLTSMMETDDPILNKLVPEAQSRRFEDDDDKRQLLLPIKNRDGNLVYRQKEGSEGQGDEDEEDDDDEPQQESEEDMPKETHDKDEPIEKRSVLSLLSSRSHLLASLRVEIGSAASNFLECPEERMQVLERLISLPEAQPKEVKAPISRLVAATVNEMLKDVLPSYRISDRDSEKNGTLLKKDTLKLLRHEKLLLACSKRHLIRLESLLHLRQVNREARKDLSARTDRLLSTRCLIDLLITHPHFNYSENIARLLVPLMDQKFQADLRDEVCKGFQNLFKEDKRGEISLKVVDMIRKWVVKKHYKGCQPELIECLRGLRLANLISGKEMEQESFNNSNKKNRLNKKKEVGESRKEKKRRKALIQVEREMLEAKGEEAKSVRDKNYLEISKIIFQMVFRVVKSCPIVEQDGDEMADDYFKDQSGLLPSCLQCLANFSSAIGVEYLYDALKALAKLVNAQGLEPKLRGLCLASAFGILNSSHGEHLNIDTAPFSKSFLDLLNTPNFWTRVSDKNSIATTSSSLSLDMVPVLRTLLVRRRRLLSPSLVRRLLKLVINFSLTLMDIDQLVNVLEALNAVKMAHPATFQGLLECNNDEVVATEDSMGLSETLWELNLLSKHYDPRVRDGASKLLVKTFNPHHL